VSAGLTVQVPRTLNTPRSLHALCERLWPICRSITGDGVRETLRVLGEHLPMHIHEVPTGTPVFDWKVPKEWNIRSAFIDGPDGSRIVDFARSNLHVMSYSTPVDAVMPLDELQRHLHSLPDFPERVPYRTSYYDERWGFCLADAVRAQLKPGNYRVKIDSTLAAGQLTYGEFFIPGRSGDELLVSTHVCHPSLANDNLSGMVVAVALAQALAAGQSKPRHGIRFIFIPGTIGAITWLGVNPETTRRIKAGVVLSGVGDRGPLTFKRSRDGDGWLDRAFTRVLTQKYEGADLNRRVRPYLPYGYDERQFCSPGIDIPMGCLMRTPYGEYDAYHTSADNLELIDAEALFDTFKACEAAFGSVLDSPRYRNLNPSCEPQLGRRGLYDAIGGNNESKALQLALLWVLAYSDGDHTFDDLTGMAEMPVPVVAKAVELLLQANLLETID
jgi:aminopeptidase-like protein